MKYVLPILLSLMLTMSTSCRKTCYKCSVYHFLAYRIDTSYQNGVPVYDTSGGQDVGIPERFSSCEVNASYHYDNYVQPFALHPDSLIFCIHEN